MIPIKGSILVWCNHDQNAEYIYGVNKLMTAKKYNDNFRERNPVIAYVAIGNEDISQGSYIICNYSHFDLESPYHLEGKKYSIPVDSEIYAIVNKDGSLTPIMGNVLVQRVDITHMVEIPPELKKKEYNQGILLNDVNGIKNGNYIFWLPMSDYEICYNWNGEERRAIKIHQSEITGYLKNT